VLRFNKNKTTKEKVREIKDIVSGKITIESLLVVMRPGGMIFVYNPQPNVYLVHEVGLNKEPSNPMNRQEYNEWYEAKKSGVYDHMIVWQSLPERTDI
jgi:hypothetical protein